MFLSHFLNFFVEFFITFLDIIFLFNFIFKPLRISFKCPKSGYIDLNEDLDVAEEQQESSLKSSQNSNLVRNSKYSKFQQYRKDLLKKSSNLASPPKSDQNNVVDSSCDVPSISDGQQHFYANSPPLSIHDVDKQSSANETSADPFSTQKVKNLLKSPDQINSSAAAVSEVDEEDLRDVLEFCSGKFDHSAPQTNRASTRCVESEDDEDDDFVDDIDGSKGFKFIGNVKEVKSNQGQVVNFLDIANNYVGQMADDCIYCLVFDITS